MNKLRLTTFNLFFIKNIVTDEDHIPQITTPSPSKKKKENQPVIQRRDETPIRASLAMKLAATKISDINVKPVQQKGTFLKFFFFSDIYMCRENSQSSTANFLKQIILRYFSCRSILCSSLVTSMFHHMTTVLVSCR